VGRHELLLFADGAEEAESVRAEADQPQRHEREQAEAGARRHSQPLTPLPRGEHEERQRQTGGDLDRHAGHQRDRGGPEARLRSRREREGRGEQEQDQRVVVSTADGQHEQNGVQSDEGRGPAARLAQPARRPCDQRDGSEA
jgi:hypothetical protein